MKTAKWIWCAGQNVHDYNLSAIFKKEFEVGAVRRAVLRITADSRYRVSLNGTWINDGPGKAYPEHWTYDVYDMAPLLKTGTNRIEVTARYYGIGTFHQIPQQAGLLAEIELDGRIIGTDASWLAAPLKYLRQQVPKVSIQMEPVESVDARLMSDLNWQPAVELFPAEAGPWKDLTPRRSEPLTKVACRTKALRSALRVAWTEPHVCVPATRICHPGVIEANSRASRPLVLSTTLVLEKDTVWNCFSKDWKGVVNGVPVEEKVLLPAGEHTVAFFCNSLFGHNKELPFPFLTMEGSQWRDWKCFAKKECLLLDNDIVWLIYAHAESDRVSKVWKDTVDQLQVEGTEVAVSAEQLFLEDFTADFAARQPEGPAVVEWEGETVTVLPEGGADVELCFDFGEQRCGYFDFDLEAPSGTVMDLHMVEYITPDGILQHTAEYNRNGMRYITMVGANQYTSLKRRSGRYLFVTFRKMSAPVVLRKLEIIESTAAVKPVEPFRCNDDMLNRIWDACERTLKMGMEDTFTDCSLYEQTLWIGDARNQALYASTIYGKYEVSARSLELGAQSLERFPIVGCQVPSSWECLLPAWSFLWGIWVWEHYVCSGDLAFLESVFPAAMKNLKGAFGFIDEHGLFSGTFWNLLEWADMDRDHPTVIHNTLLLIWACRNAEQCAETLRNQESIQWIRPRREKLAEAVNRWWDAEKKSYPDAILEEGRPSPKTCQHNSALAVLADVVPEGCMDAVRTNLLDPPAEMTRIGSPFAAQFHFEALEKLHEPQAIIDSIRKNYIPMIEAGATTVWETFPGSTCSPNGFPTRSHCHGWSCGPLWFFNRIILGIRQTEPGGKSFEVSPWVSGLQNASGAMASPHGPIHVDWELVGKILRIKINAPQGVKIEFKTNASLVGLNVECTRSES